MKSILLSFSALLCFLMVACQQAPTKIIQHEEVVTEKGQSVSALMKDQPVILDARTPFDFNLNHVPSAINVRWEDFSQQEPHMRGVLEKDLYGMARRLSLIGIDPNTPVLVLGQGPAGHGEEGRVAWTLRVLGVNKVTTVNVTELRSQPPQDAGPVLNKPTWKPVVDETLNTDILTFRKLVLNEELAPKKMLHKVSPLSKSSLANESTTVFGHALEEVKAKSVVLDVRSPAEFDLENLSQNKDIKIPVYNIEWKEFFDDRGLPGKDLQQKLEAKGITPQTYVFVISRNGVSSGAVTYALRFRGNNLVTNFAGGYDQWNNNK